MLAVKVFLCTAFIAAFLFQQGDAGWFRIRIRWEKTVETVASCYLAGCFSKQQMGDICRNLAEAVVKREDWEALEPRYVEHARSMPINVAIRHTGPETCQLMGLSGSSCQQCIEEESCLKNYIAVFQSDDLSNGYDDIKYNFLIGQDGVVYEGRGWGVVGQHTTGQNSQSLGFAMIGDFTDTEPSQASQNALKNMITCGQSVGLISRNSDLLTSPDISGKAFFEMIQRCNGLCSD